ncbi:hypothetical protein MLD38_027665 [Melastoma candidum]|uniref:Uncharacterized protein n=1 Tax=Melastoma candidum TaxID=119954 RepID=A0ACB9P543_9MYRT|nr:hypothetical protein MLD38_027665 [Melastoma candidum]
MQTNAHGNPRSTSTSPVAFRSTVSSSWLTDYTVTQGNASSHPCSCDCVVVCDHYHQTMKMGTGGGRSEMYFVFMDYDPEYKRLRSARSKRGAYELDEYVSKKHDDLLASVLEPGSYKKTLSLVIVDCFAVEISEDQARMLRSAKGVRMVEKNQEVV